MSPGQSEAPSFPVFALQPVADVHHAWVGMMLGSEGSDSGGDIARLFGEFRLADALGPLIAVLPCREKAGTLPALPAPQAVFLCGHSDGAATSTALRQNGFRVLHRLDADAAVPDEGCDALAWDCTTALNASAAAALRRLPGPHLALHVDSPEHFEKCKAAGFAWLCGDYPLHYASLNFSRSRGPAHALLLKILALVVRDADTREIEAVLKQDAQLSFQLLRLVNSAAFAHPTRISTFNQAITMLGRRQLQRWLQLLLYAHPNSAETSPLLPRAAYRARFMEALCQEMGGSHEEQDRAFMTGIFSLLDAVFGRPLAELLQPLDLAGEVVAALLERRGVLGNLLEIVSADRPDPAGGMLRQRLQAARLNSEQQARAMVAACHWATRVGRD